MKVRFIVMLLAVAIAAPAFAHHSTSMYDMNHPVTVTGTVKRFEWTNPHVWIFMDVKDDTGKKTNWGFEMGPPHLLQGSGWNREKLNLGDELIVEGSKAKNGSNKMNARTVKFAATGISLQAGSSQGQAGQQ